MSDHPFDRYSAFTDLVALKDASQRPLRKCIRTNGLKSSVAKLHEWGRGRGWKLEPVPWSKEGFFIDREDRSMPLGKDLMHLLGHIYMQEASSMLPVELLDPQPGEIVLDMAAAPGSKTTQIAAKMQNRGVVIANDMQDKRLSTLKNALHRLGVTNTIVTKHMGQWFGKEMVERFDRVLCDAPCTAQGTSRKDDEALKYSSKDSIGKMARLQRDMLECAVHAAKVGGRIVYSTCTLTSEENEEVVRSTLNKFSDQLEVLAPADSSVWTQKAVEDSYIVQKSLDPKIHEPLLRIWPQTYDTEGFFCAVLQKNASTKEWKKTETEHFQERPLRRKQQDHICEQFIKLYGTDFMEDDDQLFVLEDQILLSTERVRDFSLPSRNYSLGIPYARCIGNSKHRIAPDIIIARGAMATSNIITLTDKECKKILEGKDIECETTLRGDVIVQWNNMCIGTGLAQNGLMKNRIERWIVQQRAE